MKTKKTISVIIAVAAIVLVGYMWFGSTSNQASVATPSEHALIRVTAPTPQQKVFTPIKLSGHARGYWFFEATAPVVVTDWDGLVIGEGYITAEGDWMTEDFVPFSGSVSYRLPSDTYSTSGTVIFKKSNPSDLPENDDSYEIPVELEYTE